MDHDDNNDTNFNDVGRFHWKFGLPVAMSRAGDTKPTSLPYDAYQFRSMFMQEELDEYCEAYGEGDLAKMADALVDLVYVALGTAHMHNFDWQPLWNEVQRANMSKLRATKASDSKRAFSGQAMYPTCPSGYRPRLSDTEEEL